MFIPAAGEKCAADAVIYQPQNNILSFLQAMSQIL